MNTIIKFHLLALLILFIGLIIKLGWLSLIVFPIAALFVAANMTPFLMEMPLEKKDTKLPLSSTIAFGD